MWLNVPSSFLVQMETVASLVSDSLQSQFRWAAWPLFFSTFFSNSKDQEDTLERKKAVGVSSLTCNLKPLCGRHEQLESANNYNVSRKRVVCLKFANCRDSRLPTLESLYDVTVFVLSAFV